MLKITGLLQFLLLRLDPGLVVCFLCFSVHVNNERMNYWFAQQTKTQKYP